MRGGNEESNRWVSRIRKDFSVTIPKSLREMFDLRPMDTVQWSLYRVIDREDGGEEKDVVEIEFFGMKRKEKTL